MSNYLIFDTENTGLFDYKLPADHPTQPRLASIAMIFANEDFEVEREYYTLIRPDGWVMPEATTKIHGLTQEMLEAEGVPVLEALQIYDQAINEGRVSVAHNVQHDAKQMRAELRRAGLEDRFKDAPNICTMRGLTDVCKIPPNGNRGGYKWPKLSEACVFFGMENLGDHSALNDARACLALLHKMHELGVMPEAAVHLSKIRPSGEQ